MNLWHRIKPSWHPAPVKAPVIDNEFDHLDPLSRATEAICYFLLSLEHWLCPGGVLREWLRIVVRLACLLAIPVLLVVPLITFLLASLVKWTVLITTIAWKVVVLVVLALVGVIVSMFNWAMLKAVLLGRR